MLSGEVGAGKTTFVRAAARTLGVEGQGDEPDLPARPRLRGRRDGRPVTVNHLDLYRLEGIEDRDALELDDYLDPGAVTFIEWAEPGAWRHREPYRRPYRPRDPDHAPREPRRPRRGASKRC